MTSSLSCTVIIPAFNEEAVIERCLAALLCDAPQDHAMEIIIAANGCADRTVEIARATAPSARILDLPEGGKVGAINAANAIASHFPRIYLDADVECSHATIVALVDALNVPGAMTAAPAIRMELAGSDRFVRSYYRVWLKQPYATAASGGAGCYALSRAACVHIGSFPQIIGDDIWIHTRFPNEQKRYVSHDRTGKPVFTTVRPPRRAAEQIKVEARRQIGNAEVLRLHPSPHTLQSGNSGAWKTARESGASLPDMIVYFGMKVSARLLAKWQRMRGHGATWTRDLSSRQA